MSRPQSHTNNITSSSSRIQSDPSATRRKSPESYLELARRQEAAEILQSYEKLSWLSFARNESMAQTRLHCQNIIAGFTAEDEAARVDWREDFRPHQNRSAVQPGSARKGKARASLGRGGGEEDDDRQPDPASPAGGGRSSSGKGREKSHSGSGGSGSVQSKKKRKSGVGSG